MPTLSHLQQKGLNNFFRADSNNDTSGSSRSSNSSSNHGLYYMNSPVARGRQLSLSNLSKVFEKNVGVPEKMLPAAEELLKVAIEQGRKLIFDDLENPLLYVGAEDLSYCTLCGVRSFYLFSSSSF